MLTQERLKELLDYDTQTGLMRWRIRRGPRLAGSIAGCAGTGGYWQIGIDGRVYLRHRLAWLYVHGYWPTSEIDHRNNTPGEDWLSNLREATPLTNQQNRKGNKVRRSPLKGAFPCRTGRWYSGLNHNGKYVYLGRFDMAEEAHAAYVAAAERLFGEFARAE